MVIWEQEDVVQRKVVHHQSSLKSHLQHCGVLQSEDTSTNVSEYQAANIVGIQVVLWCRIWRVASWK